MGTGIGTYVRDRRQDLGLSQAALARRVGKPYSQSDVSRLERGQIDVPRLGTLIKLASVLEVQVGDLLIVSDWFADGPVSPTSTSTSGVDQATLITVLSEIEAELDTMLGLQLEARSRSDRLQAMIRELQ